MTDAAKSAYSAFITSLFKGKILYILFAASVIAFAITLWHRYAYIDDCWFGEQAYWLAKSGVVKTSSIHAGLGWEERLFVYHKLNIWIGAVLIRLLGWSVYILKGFTLAVYLAFFYFFQKYFKLSRTEKGRFLLAAFLVFANPLMFLYSFTFRPEILVMFLGFLSFLSLELARTSSVHQQKWAVLGGLAAGFAFLAHLNGMIFGAAGFFYLLIYRRWRLLPGYIISGILIASIYFIDLTEPGNIQQLLSQLGNWPDEISGNYLGSRSLLMKILLKLGNEHQRFFWSDRVSVFSALFFISLLFSFRYLWEKHRPILIYTGLLILLLNLLGSQIAERYLIYYVPMMAALIAFSVFNLVEKGKMLKVTVLALLFIVQLSVLVRHTAKIVSANSGFVAMNHEVAGLIPDQRAVVMAPYHFIFNEIGVFPLLTYHSLEYFEVKNRLQLDSSQALKRCRELGAKYIIVDRGLEEDPVKYRWFEGAIKGSSTDYRVMAKYKGYVILEACSPK